MNILGIDPGAKGGIAYIQNHKKVDVFKLADLTDKQVNALFLEFTPATVYIEKPSGAGSYQQFKLGENYGFIRGLLVANHIDFIPVSPQKWQQGLGLANTGLDYTKRKKLLKEKAQEFFPDTKIIADTADAALIALYGWHQILAQDDI